MKRRIADDETPHQRQNQDHPPAMQREPQAKTGKNGFFFGYYYNYIYFWHLEKTISSKKIPPCPPETETF